MKKFTSLFVLLTTLALASCTSSSKPQGQGDDKVVDVTGVTLNASEVSLDVSETYQLTATVAPSDATNKTVHWSSSDDEYVSVSESGLLTALKPGNVTVTCVSDFDENIKATCEVKVNEQGASEVKVTGVSLNRSTVSLSLNQSITLVATVLPSNATNKAVSWSSSDSNIVSVSDGLVKAQAAGSATITVKTSDGAKTATCRVTITEATVNVTSVSLNNSSLALEVGQTSTLVATVLPENATNKKVTWTSNKTSVATVSTSGLVTAKAKGTATITVKTSDGAKTATCSVTVTEAYVAVSSVSLSKSSLEVGINRTSSLTATVLPNNASDKSVSWNSSNNNVAKVSTSGVVTGVAVGTANITATTNDGNKTASCNVTVSEVTADKYTVMIYMCGADLESENQLATDDIQEILSVKNKPDDVNIIIETGGASQWASTYNISNFKLGRYVVSRNSNGSNSLKSVASLSDASMGASSTFKSFLEWGLDNYPAENTGVIFWNHGGALDGVCFDENYNSDSLTNSETSAAFKNVLSARGIDKLEFVGYDACIMQIQDVAEFNSKYFNYMVGSQESEVGEGWVYSGWVDDLYAGKDTRTILKANCDSFVNTYGEDQTLSYLDLSKMPTYFDAIESMASSIKSTVSSNKSTFNSIIYSTKIFSGNQIDGYDFLNKLGNNSKFSSFSDKITAAKTAYKQLVVYSRKGSSAGNANGLGFIAVSSYYYPSSETSFTNWRSLF